jgi:hypothetical protein
MTMFRHPSTPLGMTAAVGMVAKWALAYVASVHRFLRFPCQNGNSPVAESRHIAYPFILRRFSSAFLRTIPHQMAQSGNWTAFAPLDTEADESLTGKYFPGESVAYVPAER